MARAPLKAKQDAVVQNKSKEHEPVSGDSELTDFAVAGPTELSAAQIEQDQAVAEAEHQSNDIIHD